MSRWLQLALVAVLAVVVAEVLLRGRDGAPSPASPPGQDVAGLTAPEAPELKLETLGGAPVDLKSLRGKVVAVNFWATWCAPCQAELPDLVAVWNARHDHCFELLAVAGMSDRNDAERMAKNMPYPVLFDAKGAAVDAWAVQSVPRTFVLDTQGRVRKVFRGMIDKDELAQTVDPLLPRACPARSG